MITRDPDITRLLDRLEKRGLIARSPGNQGPAHGDGADYAGRLEVAGPAWTNRCGKRIAAQLGHLGRERLTGLDELLQAARGKQADFSAHIFVATNIVITHLN